MLNVYYFDSVIVANYARLMNLLNDACFVRFAVVQTSVPQNEAELQLYRVMQRASLLGYYDTLLEMGNLSLSCVTLVIISKMIPYKGRIYAKYIKLQPPPQKCSN